MGRGRLTYSGVYSSLTGPESPVSAAGKSNFNELPAGTPAGSFILGCSPHELHSQILTNHTTQTNEKDLTLCKEIMTFTYQGRRR